MSSIIDSLKTGQTIQCTVAKLPQAIDDRDTIARLMRNDPTNRKALRRAQHLRRQRMVVYNRGNRDWVSRETCAKVVIVAPGQAWSMPYTLDFARDLQKVEKYLTIKTK
ncbi:MAG: hypothetical protein HRU70_01650 [Phycisphaeraceae bacterium]|nr:MAG: hypothetical protein HRU70_01650 [Phycisphaeraceae bacterium]